MRSQTLFSSIGIFILLLPAAGVSSPAEQILSEGGERIKEGSSAQKTIERLDDQTLSLHAEYSTITKMVDGLEVYNQLLDTQVEHQRQELTAISDSVQQIAQMQRQIVPLMIRMIDSLDEFIELDIPFLKAERSRRIASLRTVMQRSDVSVAEKFRKVMEAYEIENEYGRTIEAYKGELETTDGSVKQVDYLRLGRIILLYQSRDGVSTGVWQQESHNWRELSPRAYRRNVEFAMKVAKKHSAPDLLILPVPAATALSQ